MKFFARIYGLLTPLYHGTPGRVNYVIDASRSDAYNVGIDFLTYGKERDDRTHATFRRCTGNFNKTR